MMGLKWNLPKTPPAEVRPVDDGAAGLDNEAVGLDDEAVELNDETAALDDDDGPDVELAADAAVEVGRWTMEQLKN